MKILLTGAHGQVGWELARRAPKRGFAVEATDVDVFDITDLRAVEERVCGPGWALVVNCAAYTAVDRAESEPELALAVNRDGPAHLAAACGAARIPLVHISTDYVFDGGKDGPYRETDPVSPLGVYGRSKAESEWEVRSRLREHIILRTSWVYGVHGQNFVKTMLRLGQERRVLRVVNDQQGCPTNAADLAEVILAIAGECDMNAWGIYHYAGKGATTWHGFAEAIFAEARKYISLLVERVEPIPSSQYPTAAKRPANSVLDCSLFTSTFGIEPRPWRESLAEVIHGLFSQEQDG
jgi:dTDP-4-dehydrorhamnose reductase